MTTITESFTSSIKLVINVINSYQIVNFFFLQETDEAIELANQVLNVKPESYEAYYARAKARLDLKLFENALADVREALRLAPPQNSEVRKVLTYLRDEINNKMSAPARMSNYHRDFAISVDTLHE